MKDETASTDKLPGVIRTRKKAQAAIGCDDTRWKLLRLIGLRPIKLGFSAKETETYRIEDLLHHMDAYAKFVEVAQALADAGVLDEVLSPLNGKEA